MTIKNLLEWDARTQMPTNGSAFRSEQIGLISQHIHSLQTEPRFIESVFTIEVSKLSLTERQQIEILQFQLAKAQALSEEFVGRLASATSECRSQWTKAKQDSNFKAVLPHFERLVDLVIERCQRFQSHSFFKTTFANKSLYEIAMDEYDRGSPTEEVMNNVRELASLTKSILPEIVEKVKQRGGSEISFAMPIEKQHQLAQKISGALGFDFTRGRLDTTEHPFAIGVGSDQRITTRYNEANFLDGLYSVIHETGHGIFEQKIPPEIKYTPRGKIHSMMMHESQSRFFEVFLCMSRPFCDYLSSQTGYPAESIYNYLNRVEQGFLRVESDEVTYNLHIAFRMKIDEQLLLGQLKAKDLPEFWNDTFEKELGLKVPSDKLGCLQDVHWYTGDYGYFPSYTMGNMIAAELFNQFSRQYPDWETQARQGDFKSVGEFLFARVHRQASLPTTSEMISTALKGEVPNPNTLLDHFRNKYLRF